MRKVARKAKRILAKNSGAPIADGWALQMSTTLSAIALAVAFSTANGRWSASINLSQLSHIVLTYNSDNVANNPIIYINGVSVLVTEDNTPIGTVDSDAGVCGALVNFTGDYAATATGSPTPTITYDPVSGTTFPFGTTTVTATATNDCGTDNCTFTVTGLKPSTRYYFFVRDVDVLGEKDSNTVSITTAILEDQDKDGLADVEEESLGTNVTNPDTDGDQCYDGWEVDMGLDPLDPLDGYYDNDNDGLLNYQEFNYHTDPLDSDSDDDGFSDGEEIDYGSDPNDRWSNKLISRLKFLGITLLIGAAFFGALIFLRKKPKSSDSIALTPLMKLHSLDIPQTLHDLEEGFTKYNQLLLTEELQKSQPHLKLTPYEIFETIEKTKLEPEPIEQITVINLHELIEPAVVEEKSSGSEKPSFQETVVISSESYEIFNKINGVMVRILLLLLFELPISLPNQVIVDKLNL